MGPSAARTAGRIALLYVLLAAAAVYLANQVFGYLLAPSRALADAFQRYGEAALFLATGGLLFLVLRRELEQRRQAEERLEQAFRREEGMGRIHNRILALRSMGEFSRELEEEWVEELRGLGVPVFRLSLQFPTQREGYFATSPWILGQNVPPTEVLLADYPWVKEAWDRGQPVVVDRPRLERAGFQPEVLALVEVPLPGGGSLGMNSQVRDAFDDEAIHLLGQFAGLVATALRRLQDSEESRQLAVRYEAILGALPDIVMEVDANKVYTWANPAGYEFFGQEVVGREAAHYFAGEQDIYSRVQPLFNGDPGLLYVESWQRRRDGQTRLLAWWCRALKDPQGRVAGALSTARDITDHWQAEKELRQSEERYRLLAENLPVAIADTTPDGQILYHNPYAQQLLGYAPADYPTLRAEDLYVRAEDRERLQAGLREKGIHSFECPLRRKDGQVVWVRGTTRVYRDQNGRVRYQGITEDITARIQEERRRAAAQRVREAVWRMRSADGLPQVLGALKASVDQLEIPFQDCDVNLVVPGESPLLRAYCISREGDWSVHEVPSRGQSLLDRFRAAGVPVYRRDLQQDDPNQEKAHIEAFFGHPVRTVVDIPFAYGTLAVNSDRAGAFSPFHLAALQDLAQVLEEGFRRLDDLQAVESERRQTERSLRLDLALQRVRNQVLQMEKEEEWAGVVAVFRDELSRLVEFDACGINIVDRGKGSFTAYGVERGGLFERGAADFLPPPLLAALDTGRPVFRRNRAEMLAAGDVLRPDRNSVVDVPFLGGTVALNSAADNAFDETDVRTLEQFARVLSESYRRLVDLRQLADKEKQLLQAQKMEAVGRLAGGVAHDFNNLLTVISGNAQLLCQDLPAGTPERAGASEIVEAGERAAALVRQLLAFSRKQVLRPEELNLNRVVLDLGKMLSRLIGEDVELRLRLDPHLGPVYADPGQMEQVLMNLVVNARDAMPQGGILTLETTNVELREQGQVVHGAPPRHGPYVVLAVRDTGVGMDQATQAHLFEPFFTTKEAGKGTGLGLATVYGIVEQSGGHIRVDSQAGKGSGFAVYLPRREGSEGSPPAGEPEPAEAYRGDESVLVVEDDAGVRQLAVRLLRAQGYRVLEARDGAEALEVLAGQDRPVALVLTDVVMPGMSGSDLAAHLGRTHPEVRILFMSGYSEHAALPPDPAGAGRDILQKPFARQTLARQVRRALDRPRPTGN